MPAHRTSRSLARYNSSGIGPFEDGASTGLFIDQYGNLLTTQGTLSAGEDIVNNRLIVENRWQYVEIETATATVSTQVSIKSGILHKIMVGDVGGGGYFVIKDTPNGTGSITILTLVGANGPGWEFDVPFTTGLWVQANNTSGASPMKFIVTYRENPT